MPEAEWYRIGPSEEAGVRQFLVQDPDGHLLRLQMSLGHRIAWAPRRREDVLELSRGKAPIVEG